MHNLKSEMKIKELSVKCPDCNAISIFRVGGKYESIIVKCTQCNKVLEFKKEELEK